MPVWRERSQMSCLHMWQLGPVMAMTSNSPWIEACASAVASECMVRVSVSESYEIPSYMLPALVKTVTA